MIRFDFERDAHPYSREIYSCPVSLQAPRREVCATIGVTNTWDKHITLSNVVDHDGRTLSDLAICRTRTLAGVATGDRVRLRVTIDVKVTRFGSVSLRLLRPHLVGMSGPRLALVEAA